MYDCVLEIRGSAYDFKSVCVCVCVCVSTSVSAFLITDVCVILRVYVKVSVVHRPMHAQGG